MFDKVKAFFLAHPSLKLVLMLVVGFALAFVPQALLLHAGASAAHAARFPQSSIIFTLCTSGIAVLVEWRYRKIIAAKLDGIATKTQNALYKVENVSQGLTEREVNEVKAFVKAGGAFTEAEFAYLKNMAVVGITTKPPSPAA